MFEVGKKYRVEGYDTTRECWSVQEGGRFAWVSSPQHACGIIWDWNEFVFEEVPDPIKVDGWVNVFREPDGSLRFGPSWKSKSQAEETALTLQLAEYVATIRVRGTQGED